MKHTILSLLLIISSIVGYTSCDSMIASSLEGTWEGEMYFASYYDGEWYYSNYTQIEFIGDPMRFKSGKGYWVDQYSSAPWDYIANHFSWRVDDKIIYIHLLEDNYDIEIRDYRIDELHFSGNVYYEGEDRHFDLYHTSSPNWDDYDYGYGYGYYSPKRVPADSVAASPMHDDVPPMLKERPKRILVPAPKQ